MFLFTKHGGFNLNKENLKSPKIIAPLAISLLTQPVFLSIYEIFSAIWYHLYKKKRWKAPMEEWYFYSCRLNAETLQKVTLVHGYFLRFWNCTNGTKSRKASQMCFRALMMYLMLNSNIWGFRDYKDFIWYKYWHLASTNIKAQQPPPMVKTADFGVSERHLLFNSDKIDFFYMADVALHIFNGFHSMRTFPFTINPFVPNASFLYSLKISQNLMVFTEECIRKKWIKQFYVLQ